MKKLLFQANQTLDCSLYKNDYDILASFPFDAKIASDNEFYSTTFAREEIENQINAVFIQNEKVLPRIIFCLKHLRYFSITSSRIIPYISDNDADFQFPSEIERLATSLISIHIHNTKVTQLPEEFSKLKHLSSLDMGNNGLINLPDSFDNLTSLRFLRLGENSLVSLPKTTANLELLHMIILAGNSPLQSLQSLNGIRNLRYIAAGYCSIDHLPYNVPNLNELLMSHNNLTNLYGIETLGYNTSESKPFDFG